MMDKRNTTCDGFAISNQLGKVHKLLIKYVPNRLNQPILSLFIATRVSFCLKGENIKSQWQIH